MNKSDSERIAGYLEKHGWILADTPNHANLVIFNTCGIRQRAEDRAYGLIHKTRKENKNAKIILTGCLSNKKDVARKLKGKVDMFLPITELENLEVKFYNKKIKLKKLDYLKLKPKYKSKISAFVPIGNGCNNFCSYCVVPYARGVEIYRQASEILDEVSYLVKNGYKEINLIAQNVNSYNDVDIASKVKNINFSSLLKMVNNVKGDFWIRFSTSHPKDMSDELVCIVCESNKICEHIHLPAQSGDSDVLRKMNRKYSCQDYIKLVEKIKNIFNSKKTSKNKQISITTDIIVGFPGETKKQFENTKKLFKDLKFDMAYVSEYSPRNGTIAVKFKDNISREEKKKRKKELMDILKKTMLENNKKYVNEIVEVLVDNKNSSGEFVGKTRTGKIVKIRKIQNSKFKNKNLIGEFVKVKILNLGNFKFEGLLV